MRVSAQLYSNGRLPQLSRSNGGRRWVRGVLDPFRGSGGARHPLGEVAPIVVRNISLPPNVFGGPGIADLLLNRLD